MAQISMHQYDKSLHHAEVIQDVFTSSQNSTFTPLAFDKSKMLKKKVFGYLPYWQFLSTPANLQYDLLTHIACFDFSCDSIGNIAAPLYWPWTDVINKSHSNGVKVVASVTCFNGKYIHQIITTSSIQQKIFTNLGNLLSQYQLDGINIDFENLLNTDSGLLFNNFITSLRSYLNSNYPSAELSVATPPLTAGWDMNSLSASCDYLFLMGYNYYGSWSATTGPTAPLLGTGASINDMVTIQYGIVSNKQKLILGVPYYGIKWTTKTNQAHASVTKFIDYTTFSSDYANALKYGELWSSADQTPWYTYPGDTGWTQVWYDNAKSLGLKYDLAESNNFGGVGIWALGYDNGTSVLWNELRSRYFITQAVQDGNYSSSEKNFRPVLTNYPNPFNPSTTISLTLPHDGNACVTLVNSIGVEMAKINEGYMVKGNHQFYFNAATFPSGIMFLKLDFEGMQTIRPILLLK